VKPSILAAIVAATLFLVPVAHADSVAVPIGDPYTDTLQLWSEIAATGQIVAHDLAALFQPQQFATSQTPQRPHTPKQLPVALTASAATAVSSLPQTETPEENDTNDSGAASSPQSRSPPTAGPSSVIYRVVQTPAFDATAFVTHDQFNAAMAALGSSVQQLLAVSQSTPLPQYVAADGNAAIPYAAENNITNLSNVTITNPNISGLSASDIPDLSGTYLSLSGGAVSGTTSFANDVGIGTTSPSDVLAVNGPIFLANVSPTATSNRLYSNGGALYWNGSLLGGASVGNWATDGTNVWRPGGNVGIGTTSPGSALSVAGNGYFTGNLVASGNTTLGNATSTNFFSAIGDFTTGVINSLSGTTLTYTAASTTNLSVSGNATLGNATSTNLAVTGTASTSNLVASNSFTLGSLTGVLHAVSGVISASLVNLASDVSGVLPVANGGTGWANVASGAIPYGNGGSALATTSAGTAGYVLAYLNGVPTWTATTTLTNISGTLAVNQGGTGSTTLSGILKGNGTGALQTAIAGTDYLAPSSLSAAYPLLYSGNNFTLAFGTTTANAWSQLQTLQGGFVSQASSTIVGTLSLTGTLSAQGATFNGSLAAQGGGTLSGTFSGTPIFNSGFISQASSTFSSTLNANTLSLLNPLGVGSGGTGANTFGQGWIYSNGGTGALAASTSPTVSYLTATSTTATSTFAGNLSVGGNLNFNGSFLQNGLPFIGSQWTTTGSNIYYTAGNVGIGTTTPDEKLLVASAAGSYTAIGISSLGTGGHEYKLISANNSNGGIGGGAFGIWDATIGTYRLAIGNTGNIGIGTTSPATTLSVAGNGYLTGGLGVGVENTTAGTINASSFINTSGTTGGYQIDGNLILQASSTNSGVFVGNSAGANLLSTALRNTALGYGALEYATSTNDNTAVGYKTLLGASNNGSTGIENTAVGSLAMELDSTGGNNTALGYAALQLNTTGANNVAIGNALSANTTGQYNIAIDNGALTTNTTGARNAAIGYDALNDTTGSDNTALGYFALLNDTTGQQNFGLGKAAGDLNTTGSGNISIGYDAAVGNASATSTIAIGFCAAGGNGCSGTPFSAQGYTVLGYNAGQAFQTGSNYNTLLGYQSGYDITTGSNNLILGTEQTTGSGITTGSNNIVIGNNTSALTATANNQLDIGNLIFGTGLSGAGSTIAGNIGIGTTHPYSLLQVTGPDTASTSAFAVVNSASTTVFSVFDDGNSTYSGSIFQSSDQRLKTDVQSLDSSSSLSAIELLNPVSYLRLDQPGTGENLGFIAQQVRQVFPQLVSTTSATALTPGGTLTLNYEGLISPIVSAIQALYADVQSLEQTVAGFAQSITSQQGTFTNELCVGATCVTPAQFQAMVAAANASQSSGQGSGGTNSLTGSTATDTPPVIQINGDNPAIVQAGSTYNDLGATITGPKQDLNLGISTYVNGVAVSPVQIDTSAAATDTVQYVATDQNGLTSTSTRTVIIEAPANDNQATSTPANDNSPPPAATTISATTTAQ
jgi:hypothetical protein